MGLFDSINISTRCPVCGETDDCLQTKNLENMLLTFKVGDPIQMSGEYIEKGYITGIAWCRKCDAGRYYKIFIDEGKISGKIELVEENAHEK